MKYFILTLICFIILIGNTNSQDLPINTKKSNIYEFLDEMASEKLIEINSVIKPFSREYVASKLKDLESFKSLLNKRQQQELEFYLKEFEKEINSVNTSDNIIKRVREIKKPHNRRADLFYYRDSIFNFWVNPIGGYQYFSNKNGSFHHQWSGVEALASIGNWSIYSSFRDNEVTQLIMKPDYLSIRTGEDNKSGDYFSDMRGGAFYSFKWGSVGFIKDEFVWGNNIHGSNIFSGRIPTIPQFKLQMSPVKWLDFTYIHAWLVSNVIDSLRIFDFGDGAVRKEFYPKYLAANMYTLKLIKHLDISMGNSMVYSNTNVQPAYLIPFILFKSVEHTIAASNENNAQIFFDFSSRNIKHLHLFGTFYIDEVNFGNMWDPEKHSNWFSYKAGFNLYNFPLKNLSFAGEWTRTNPMVFKHYYPTSTFESNSYNMGNYLKDNSQEFYGGLTYKPFKTLRLKANYNYAEKGPDYPDIRNDPSNPVVGKKFMTEKEWTSKALGLSAEYEIFNDAYLGFDYIIQDVWAKDQATLDKYTASFYQGKTNTFSLRLNFSY